MTTQRPPAEAPLTPPAADPQQAPDSDPSAAQEPAQASDGTARSEADLAAAIEAGFAPKQPAFERGTTISTSGAAGAAQRARAKFDEQPFVAEGCEAFAERIANERRSDVTVNASELRLSRRGFLVDRDHRYVLTPHAFKSIVTRMGIGGAGYLTKCWPELRAINFNRWADRIATAEHEAHEANVAAIARNPKMKPYEQRQLVLRTRGNANAPAREAFGVVTPSYTTFDVDRIAQALAMAAPDGARGSVSYNGRGARFDVLFRTTREPSEFVSGEFFRAGVAIRTDDTGSGSVLIRALVHQHLCDNMIMIDRCAKDVIRLQHRGSVEDLATRFRSGFELALGKLEHFLVAWGYAKTENVVARAQLATTDTIPIRAEDALPGLFNGILDRELVAVRGKAKNVVPILMQMWRDDVSSDAGRCNRAAIVNAFTRYAHTAENDELTDEIQTGASALLFGHGDRDPNPLPYLPLAA